MPRSRNTNTKKASKKGHRSAGRTAYKKQRTLTSVRRPSRSTRSSNKRSLHYKGRFTKRCTPETVKELIESSFLKITNAVKIASIRNRERYIYISKHPGATFKYTVMWTMPFDESTSTTPKCRGVTAIYANGWTNGKSNHLKHFIDTGVLHFNRYETYQANNWALTGSSQPDEYEDINVSERMFDLSNANRIVLNQDKLPGFLKD